MIKLYSYMQRKKRDNSKAKNHVEKKCLFYFVFSDSCTSFCLSNSPLYHVVQVFIPSSIPTTGE